jgi:UDP-glucuronate 4-epimerase
MRILITGAAGFIGSHLAERLSLLGHEVIGIDNFSDYYSPELKHINRRDIESKGVRMIQGDLRIVSDLEKLPGTFDAVFHLAAQPGISSDVTFEAYLDNNVSATQNLLNFVMGKSVPELFVNISTSSVYGAIATKSEDEAPGPVSWYGVTKLAAEQLVMAQARLGRLNACSLRLFSVYGPRERPDKLFSRLISCGFNQSVFPLFEDSLNHLRSFTYVGDIVDGMVKTLDHPVAVNKAVINLGNAEERSTREGIETVEDLLGRKIPVRLMSPRNGDQLRTCADIRLAKKLLGYTPSTTLREGLEKQTSWYREKFLQI